jgi:hypothetical protein
MDKRLGYYTCNGQEFESKIQALALSNQTGKPVDWQFNNEVFDNYTWTQEPELSLDQLYDRRSREIRESYDYVILSYSGGSDSHNILESFLRQGLFIDEIVINGAFKATEKFIVLDTAQTANWNINAEYQLNAVDKLKEIQARSPGTKITVNDTTDAIVDAFVQGSDGAWAKNKKEVLNPNGTNNFNLTFFRDLRVTFDKGKHVALVIGLDKPKVRVIDGQCYLFFIDKIANITQIQDHIVEYPNLRTEMFYWHPDSCDMLAKQAHVILRLINSNEQYRKIFEDTSVKAMRFTQESLLKTLIYTTWKQEWFQVDKPVKDWDCEYDYWFSRGWAGTEAHRNWWRGLDYVAKQIGANTKNGFLGIAPILSKFYYIGPVTGQ